MQGRTTQMATEATEETKARIKAAIARIAEAYGVDKKQLLVIFGCKANVVNNWVYFGRIPFPHLERCKDKTGASIDWLLYGEQPAVFVSADSLVALQQLANQSIDAGIGFGLIKSGSADGSTLLANRMLKDVLNFLGAVQHTKTAKTTKTAKS
jgi:hypothetical protein